MKIRLIRLAQAFVLLACGVAQPVQSTESSAPSARLTALAMHGQPAFAGATSLPYANPDAPKGGKIELGLQGTFDSLNPFKG